MSYQAVLGKSFKICSALFVALAGISAIVTLFFIENAVAADAVVVDFQTIENFAPFGVAARGEAVRYFAIVEYHASALQDDTNRITLAQGSFNQRYEIGDTIPILLSQRNSKRAVANSYREIWGRTAIFALLALIFAAISVSARHAFKVGTHGKSMTTR